MQLRVLDESDRNCSFDCSSDINVKKSSKLVEMSLPDLDSSSSILAGGLWISDCLEKCLLPTTCCTFLQSSPPNPEAVV